ncbi:MAG: DUF4365 domain-containing protein [Candidatus Izemoplasmatales bacterium]
MNISTRSKAALGVNYVEKIVNLNDDIMTRIPQENDRGLDIVIEYKDKNGEFYTFSAQVKSGKSYFNVNNDEISIASDFHHFKYWMNHNLYVILFVYHPETEQCFWLDLTSYVNELEDTKNFRIKSKSIRILNTETYQDLIEYVNDKIGDHKKNYLLSKTIRTIISMPNNEKDEKILYSALNHRNEVFLWITILYKLRTTKDIKVLRFLVMILSYITHNPDIWWNKYNTLNEDVKKLAVEELNSHFNDEMIIKLLSSFDVDEYLRGQLGQSVFHILELNVNSSLYLLNFIKNKNIDSDLRYKAWILYPTYRINYDEELNNKEIWLDELTKEGVIDFEMNKIFHKVLKSEGLFYYD